MSVVTARQQTYLLSFFRSLCGTTRVPMQVGGHVLAVIKIINNTRRSTGYSCELKGGTLHIQIFPSALCFWLDLSVINSTQKPAPIVCCQDEYDKSSGHYFFTLVIWTERTRDQPWRGNKYPWLMPRRRSLVIVSGNCAPRLPKYVTCPTVYCVKSLFLIWIFSCRSIYYFRCRWRLLLPPALFRVGPPNETAEPPGHKFYRWATTFGGKGRPLDANEQLADKSDAGANFPAVESWCSPRCSRW